jgi:hypothetical protein
MKKVISLLTLALVAPIVALANVPIRDQEKHPPKNFTNGLGMKFVWIPPGSFMMGSPKKGSCLP